MPTCLNRPGEEFQASRLGMVMLGYPSGLQKSCMGLRISDSGPKVQLESRQFEISILRSPAKPGFGPAHHLRTAAREGTGLAPSLQGMRMSGRGATLSSFAFCLPSFM